MVYCDLIIDVLFGVGLIRFIIGVIVDLIIIINNLFIFVVSIDLFLGIEIDMGEILGVVVEVDWSFCFGFWK